MAALPFRADLKNLGVFASWREVFLIASWRAIRSRRSPRCFQLKHLEVDSPSYGESQATKKRVSGFSLIVEQRSCLNF
jgi:hypothetical protein